MNKQAFLQETYDSAFNDELEKISGKLKIYEPLVLGSKKFKNLTSGRLNKFIESRNKITGSKLGNTKRDNIIRDSLKRSAEATEYNILKYKKI